MSFFGDAREDDTPVLQEQDEARLELESVVAIRFHEISAVRIRKLYDSGYQTNFYGCPF